MRMMYRPRGPADEETRPATPPGKAAANSSMLLVPDLQPLRMWPCHYAKAADALGFLKAIDHIEVNATVKRHGKLLYAVQVFLKNPEIRIPTSRNSATRRSSAAADGAPQRRHSVTELPTTTTSAPQQQDADYQVEREFADFVKLRYNIWVHAQQPRPARGCIYCDDITAFVGDSSKRPSGIVEKLWATKAHRKDMMEAYLNRMVALAIGRGGDGQRSPHCHGFDHIPYRLVRFLKKAGEVNHLQ
ncbi:hypothetical protein PHYSODRAFT_284930 [Phytophthora sojae]|uniref:Uncharacterized protein n=1 Tax=Phytophthora sojae (strain P6497) TaxID=1094619 RepID=G4YWU5_PHYSP|nr:hypothetical protein PHYSODRAFT_284930 [Phytophthora sojae]EGZ24443.1 hypothetical protein PHYSODRAFT_284930 [Phytophthora sojae]|eukprot:XP_009519731.1 hypothetical protein PHYSODRAFT_284930 [Phytophthora sojae]